MNDTYLTLRQVADLLHFSYNYAKVIYPQWIKFGVVPIRRNGNGRLLFKQLEIKRLVESWKVLKEV